MAAEDGPANLFWLTGRAEQRIGAWQDKLT
jgi:hypothetical protein